MNQLAIAETRDLKIVSRLPYVPELADGYGVDAVRWKVLCDTVFPNAKSLDSVVMALTYCKARGLDIFKRPVHIVPMWSSAAGGMIDTIWPGIAELRTTAMRTKQYAGISACEFGPMVTQLWEKPSPAVPAGVTVKFPLWAQMTVSRLLPNGDVGLFAGPKVYWIEAYATAGKDKPWPNDMWQRRPQGQIEKCAEAAALRRAFPEELGNDYAAEEMEGHVIDDGRAPRAPAPAVPESAKAIAPPVDRPAQEEGAAKPQAAPSDPPAQRKPPKPPAITITAQSGIKAEESSLVPDGKPLDFALHKSNFEFDLAGSSTMDEIDDLDATYRLNIPHKMTKPQYLELQAIYERRAGEIAG